MLKIFKKSDWIELIKTNLLECPYHKGQMPYEFTPSENLIVTINTKTSRHYTFGGPAWNATVDISEEEYIYLSYLSPLKKPRRIKWDNIKSIAFCHGQWINNMRKSFFSLGLLLLCLQ